MTNKDNFRRDDWRLPQSAKRGDSRRNGHHEPSPLSLRRAGSMRSADTVATRPEDRAAADDSDRPDQWPRETKSEDGRTVMDGLGANATDGCPERPGPPGWHQAQHVVEDWYSMHAAVGRVVVVEHDHRGIFEYLLDEIVQVCQDRRRVRLAHHGAFEYGGRCRTGPSGRVKLLVPTRDVVHAAANGRSWFRGRPGYRRDLLSFERRLAQLVERDGPSGSNRQ